MAQNDRIVYGGYTQAELDAQYEQRTLVPDLTAYMARWSAGSAEARETLECRLGVPYGPSEDELLDLFLAPVAGAPIHVHIHGGAWRWIGRDVSSFPAPVFVGAGMNFAVLDFGLVPAIALAEQVAQVRRAIAWLHRNADDFGGDRARIQVSGQSSGAHLGAMALAPGDDLPPRAVHSAVLACGAYDLEPVRLSARNDYLHLDPPMARALSPIAQIAEEGPPVFVAWGEGELDEFRRQSRAFADAWAARGNPVESLEFAGRNHFDMWDEFADPDSPIVAAAQRLIGV
jgi:arylformamidase